jgi:hypothetical protein
MPRKHRQAHRQLESAVEIATLENSFDDCAAQWRMRVLEAEGLESSL